MLRLLSAVIVLNNLGLIEKSGLNDNDLVNYSTTALKVDAGRPSAFTRLARVKGCHA